jgi:hypothetical protein
MESKMIELSVSAPSECVFPMGARVELFGLQNLSMNGTTGTVVSSVNSEGRVGVDLGVQGVKNIKPDNLRWQQQAFQPVFNLPQQDFQVVQLNPPQQAFQPMQLNPPQPNCQPMQLPMQLNSPQQALQPMQLNPPQPNFQPIARPQIIYSVPLQKCPTQPHLPQQGPLFQLNHSIKPAISTCILHVMFLQFKALRSKVVIQIGLCNCRSIN